MARQAKQKSLIGTLLFSAGVLWVGVTMVAFILSFFMGKQDNNLPLSAPIELPGAPTSTIGTLTIVDLTPCAATGQCSSGFVTSKDYGKPSPAQVQDVSAVCAERFKADDTLTTCIADLLAMAKHETGFICEHVGDQGRSHGCFQVRVDFVGRPDRSTLLDFRKSARWTLDRMVGFGYPDNRRYAIRKHNGSGPGAERYADDVMRTSDWIQSFTN